MMLGEKLIEIEGAFHTLGWQPEDTFQPVLMMLIGDDLEVRCMNRLRDVWDKVDVAPGLMVLKMAIESEPDEMRTMLFEDLKDVRGLALLTEGFALVGPRAEVEAQVERKERVTRDIEGAVEHRVVLGALFDDYQSDTVWGASRFAGDDQATIDRGYGGTLSDVFLDFIEEARKVLT